MEKQILTVINQTQNEIAVHRLEQIIKDALILLNINCYNLTVILADDILISNLNQRYLSHEGSTDVIAFVIEKGSESLEGELYLGIEEINRNSLEYKTSFWWELCFCLMHGLLHLGGWDDADELSRSLMYKKQRELLVRLGICDG